MTKIPTAVATDPILLIEAVANVNDWDYERDTGADTSSVRMPGIYSNYLVNIKWLESSEMLIVRVMIPVFLIPEYMVFETYELLNLMNEQSIYGSWFVDFSDENSNYFVWRQEIHSDIESVSEERLARMLAHCRIACDGFYPTIQMFLTARPTFRKSGDSIYLVNLGLTAEEAMGFSDDLHPVGTA
jgi:hypothetical protein